MAVQVFGTMLHHAMESSPAPILTSLTVEGRIDLEVNVRPPPAKRGPEQPGRKGQFIHALAVFISGDAARKSVELERGSYGAREWSELRNASPIFGWMGVEETERLLTDFFS